MPGDPSARRGREGGPHASPGSSTLAAPAGSLQVGSEVLPAQRSLAELNSTVQETPVSISSSAQNPCRTNPGLSHPHPSPQLGLWLCCRNSARSSWLCQAGLCSCAHGKLFPLLGQQALSQTLLGEAFACTDLLSNRFCCLL